MTTIITKSQLKKMIKEAVLKEQKIPTAWASTTYPIWIDYYENLREATRAYFNTSRKYSDNFDPELAEQLQELDSRFRLLLKDYDLFFKNVVRINKKLRRSKTYEEDYLT